jgi:uncharacterized protein (TIGR00251 family)
MKLFLKVKPNAKQDAIEQISENVYRVIVKAPPVNGQANRAVLHLLGKHYGIPKSQITILAGEKSHQKIVLVPDGIIQ